MWYAAQTQFNKEFVVRDHLQQQGFTETFLPTYQTTYASRNVRTKLLFRNYIFINLDDPMLWPRIQHTIGVSQMLTYAPPEPEDIEAPWYRVPLEIEYSAIESLRDQALNLDETRRDLITKGCYVRVLSGPFMQQAQRALVTWADKDRAKLLLDIFNRKVSVEFFHVDLALASENDAAY